MNVASACGYTDANYKGAQPLYEDFKDRGFAILAVPCDCFGNQEPGSDAEIKRFAIEKYGVTFPLFAKIAAVNGPDAAPLFDWVRLQPGFDAEYTWNFNKVCTRGGGRACGAAELLLPPLLSGAWHACMRQCGRVKRALARQERA